MSKDNPILKGITPEYKEKLAKSLTPTSNVHFVTGYGELVPEDKGLSRGMNQQALRNKNQSNWKAFGNAAGRLSKIPFSILSNVGAALDVEDYVNQDAEVGNWLSNWAEQVKGNIDESLPIYQRGEGPLDVGDPKWWFTNGSGLVESATAFVGTGYLLGGSLSALSKAANASKWLNTAAQGAAWLGNTVALNQAEGLGVATNVYKNVYDRELNKALDKGIEINEEIESDIKQKASEAAASSINFNRANILLNLSSAHAFMRTSPRSITRNLVDKKTKLNTVKNSFFEGIQESGEEIINMLAEKQAVSEKDYGLTDAIKDVLTKEGAEAAILGFIGGAGQTTLSTIPNNTTAFGLGQNIDGQQMSKVAYNNKLYEDQQVLINEFDDIAKANNFDGITDVFNATEKTTDLIDKINRFNADSDPIRADQAKKDLLAVQALRAFKAGATEPLIDLYSHIATQEDQYFEDRGLDPKEAKEQAKKAVSTIQDLEKLYLNSHKYSNTDEVFNTYYNIYNTSQLEEERQEAETKLVSALDSVIQTGIDSNNLNIEYKETTETKGEKPGDKVIKEEEKTIDYDPLNIDENPYDRGDKAHGVYQIFKEKVKTFKEYNEIEQNKDAREKLSKILFEQYRTLAKITSKEYQESLEKQEEYAAELNEIKNETNDPVEKAEKVKELGKKHKPKIKNKKAKQAIEQIEEEVEEQKETQRIKVKTQTNEQKENVGSNVESKTNKVDDLLGTTSDKDKDIKSDQDQESEENVNEDGYDDLLEKAAYLAAKQQMSNPKNLQRNLNIGNNRAKRIIQQLKDLNIIDENGFVETDDKAKIDEILQKAGVIQEQAPVEETVESVNVQEETLDEAIDPAEELFDSTKGNSTKAGKLAFLSKNYKRDKNKITDLDEDLIEQHIDLLHPDKFLEGTIVEVRPLHSNINPHEFADYIMNEAFEVIHDGKVVGYLHKPEWILKNVKENTQEAYKTLIAYRRYVLENGGAKTKIIYKGVGNLHKTKESKNLLEQNHNKDNNSLAVAGSDGKLYINNELHPVYKNGNIINRSVLENNTKSVSGKTYSIVRVRGNDYLAVPVYHRLLSETAIGKKIVNDLIKDVKSFLDDDKKNAAELADRVLKYIRTRSKKVVNNSVQPYKYTINTNENGALIIGLSDGSNLMGKYKYIRLTDDLNKLPDNTKNSILKHVRAALNESYTRTVKDELNNNDYKNLLNKLLHTTVKGTEIDGEISYIVQPLISIEYSDYDLQTPTDVVEEEVTDNTVYVYGKHSYLKSKQVYKGEVINKTTIDPFTSEVLEDAIYEIKVTVERGGKLIDVIIKGTSKDLFPEQNKIDENKQIADNTKEESNTEFDSELNEFLDSDDLFLSPKTLDENQIKKYKALRKIDKYFIDGMSPDKVESNIRFLSNILIDNKEEDVLDHILELENKVQKSIDSGKVEGARLERAKKLANELELFIDNFDTLVKLSRDRVKQYNLFNILKDEEIITQHIKEFYEIDPKSTVTKQIKAMMQRIVDTDSTGKHLKNYLMLPKYLSWDVVYNTLKEVLADTNHDYDSVMSKLREEAEYKPWINQVIERLEDPNSRLTRQFVASMPSHALDMEFISFSTKNDNYYSFIWKSNGNDLKRKIANTWQNNIINTNIYKVVNGDYVLDVEYSRELINEYYSWLALEVPKSVSDLINKEVKSRQTNLTDLSDDLRDKLSRIKPNSYIRNGKEYFRVSVSDNTLRLEKVEKKDLFTKPTNKQVKEFVGKFGIELSEGAWTKIFNEGYKHNRKKVTNLFQKPSDNSVSFLAALVNNLENLITSDPELIDIENTPLSDSVILKTLANLESKFNNMELPNSFRDEGKSVYTFTNSKFATDRIKYLKNNDNNIVDNLLNTKFAQNSEWLQNLKGKNADAFASIFNIKHLGLTALKEIGKKYTSKRKIGNLDTTEHEFVKIAMFQDLNQGTTATGRTARFFFPTMADKTTMLLVQTSVVDFASFKSKYLDVNNLLNDEGIGYLYNKLVKPELDRIIDFNANGDNVNIRDYVKGASKFLFFPEMNDLKIKGGFTIEEMLKDNGEGGPSPEVMNEIERALKAKMVDYIYANVNKKVQSWQELGLDKKLNAKYLKKIKGNKADKLNKAALDFELNYMLSNMNLYQTFVGDPALYYMSGDTNVEASINTFDNALKRLANQLAPGTKLANSEDNKYNELILKDRITESLAYQYIKKNIGVEAAESYRKIESTDAQEFTTILEELYITFNTGKMSESLYKKVIGIITKEIKAGNHYYDQQIIDQLTDDEYSEFTQLLFQPRKPVYTGQTFDNSTPHSVSRTVYVKSSSYPLSPSLTAGLEIDKLRIMAEQLEAKRLVLKDDMIDSGTLRIGFDTAMKVGNVKDSLDIFDDKGNIKDDIDINDLDHTVLELERKNFRIQLEKPLKQVNEIKRGTQESKILFQDILDIENINYNGKKVTAYELLKEYEDVYEEVYDIQYYNLLKELGITKIADIPNVPEFNQNLQKILKREAVDRNYNIKDIQSLELDENGNFILPLWANSSHYKFESLLNSIINNRVLKIMMPGYGYVLGTEEGFKTKTATLEEANDKNLMNQSDIIWTEAWTGKLLPAEINGGRAQVIIPNKIVDENGNIIDLYEYTYTDDDGKIMLDTSQVDKSILDRIGFRIPTSGLISLKSIEVVGFLPPEAGDLVIAPRDFIAQMGSDFDIDILYTYNYYYHIGKKGIRKYQGKDNLKILKNKIIDIHHALLDNPKVRQKVSKPLSFAYASQQADMIDNLKSNDKFTSLSSDYQREKLLQAHSGKVAVGSSSLDVTFHAQAQRLFYENTPLVLKEKVFTQDGRVIKVPLKLNIGGIKSEGKLGMVDTLDGNNAISDDNTEVQNFAVDNEKAKIMGRINLNEETLGAEKAMRLLGFSRGTDGNSIRYLLLSQPIIKDYVKLIKQAKSAFAEYDPDFKQNVIRELIKKYNTNTKKYNYGLDYIIPKDVKEGFKDLTTKELFDNLTNTNNDTQIKALELFLLMSDYGQSITKLQTSTNVDAAGMPKSIPEALEMFESADLLGGIIGNTYRMYGELFEAKNIEPLDSDIRLSKNMYLRPRGIIGKAFKNGLVTANNIWNEHFPYGVTMFDQVTNEIQAMSSLSEDASDKRKANVRMHVFSEFKKYLNSRIYSNGLSEIARSSQERQRLFIDSENNQSLASYLKTLRTINKAIANNSFLRLLDLKVQKNGMPSTIEFNNAVAENMEESVVYGSAYDLLLRNDIKLPNFNGKEMTPQILMQELALYAYLEGGVQQARQFVKFIPYEYLVVSGYAKTMNQVDFNNPNIYGDKVNEVRSFVRQYFQHNPNKAYRIEKLNDINEILQNTEIVPPKFISFYDNKSKATNKRDKYHLYEFDEENETYNRVGILGTFGMSEYQYRNSFASSVVNKINTEGAKEVSQEDLKELDESIAEKYDYKEGGKDQIESVLNNIIEKADSPLHKELAEYYKNNLDKISDVKLVIGNAPHDGAYYNNKTKTIGFNNYYLNNKRLDQHKDFAEKFLHELTHAFTIKLINTQEAYKGNKEVIDRLWKLREEARKIIIKKYGKKALEKFEKDFKAKKPISNADRDKFYGVANLNDNTVELGEFISEIMTSPAFQQELSQVITKNYDKSLFDRFVDLLKRLFVNSGILPKSITASSVSNVIRLIEGENKPKPVAKKATKNEKIYSKAWEAEINNKSKKVLGKKNDEIDPLGSTKLSENADNDALYDEYVEDTIKEENDKKDKDDQSDWEVVAVLSPKVKDVIDSMTKEEAKLFRELRRQGLIKTKNC